jgi:hypothetical protein
LLGGGLRGGGGCGAFSGHRLVSFGNVSEDFRLRVSPLPNPPRRREGTGRILLLFP